MPAAFRPEDFFMTNDWEPEPLPIGEVRRAYAKDPANSLHFEEAKIATNLGPAADDYVGAKTRISVVGYDLPNVTAADYPWLGRLRDWMERGAKVRYIAQKVSDEAREKLAVLAAEYPGQFELRVLAADEALDDRARKLAAQWKTFHFVVFENEPQLWVEMFHPAAVCEAHECYYFAPPRAREMTLHEVCLERFDHMFERAAEKVI
jgi:hypothetical protein